MGERDPRIDPKPGDMLRFRDRERHVTAVTDHWYASGLGGKAVDYMDVRKSGVVGRLRCSLGAWRSWAKRPAIEVTQTEK